MKKEELISIIILAVIFTLTISEGQHEGKARFLEKYYPERYAHIYRQEINNSNVTYYPADLYVIHGSRVYRRTKEGWSGAYPVPLEN